jgi:RNA polymerase sigma factor (sigma-70 family)
MSTTACRAPASVAIAGMAAGHIDDNSVKAEPSTSSRVEAEFERIFLPHLDAAWSLARLLMRNPQDAEDAVQESYLRALRSFSGFRGEASRSWLLTIVRNTCFTWMRSNRERADQAEFREEIHVVAAATPESQSLSRERSHAVARCIEQLPLDFREAIILRELKQMSYREIAEITGVPSGTVMSRLARARSRLASCLKIRLGGAGGPLNAISEQLP